MRSFFARRGALTAAVVFLAAFTAFVFVSRAPRGTRAEAEGERGPGEADDWFAGQRMAPDGTIHYEARFAAIREAHAMRERAAAEGVLTSTPVWQSLGPTNIGGRITTLVADPTNPLKLYVGAATGGIWKTTDGGTTWSPIFDGIGSQSIGAVALKPGDSNVLYVGTGEANAGGGSVAYGGDGVWKTTDGGVTWTSLGLGATISIGRVVVDPVTPNRVWVAAEGDLYSKGPDRGLYRSTNGGTNWTRVLYVSDSTGCVDVAVDPSNTNRVYAAMWERMRRPDMRMYGGVTSGLWRSTDGGTTWTQLTNGLPPSSSRPGRIGVAVSPSTPSTVYAIYYDATGNFAGFFRSQDSGDTWVRRADGPLPGDSSYGWWFGQIWIDPSSADKVWVDGVSLYRSLNGGGSWSSIGSSMHVDHHAQWFQPSNPNTIYEGNDGGLYKSTNGGTSWSQIANLPINQFYAMDVHPTQPQKPYAGAQDNGTLRTPAGLPNGWEMILGGDGQCVNVDINNTNVIYAEYQYGAFYKSTNGGASFNSATSGLSGSDRYNWCTPEAIDPASAGKPQTTLYLGANRLYRSVNSAGSWTAVSGDLSNGDGGSGGVVYGTIVTISVAPSDSATIWAGTDDGNVWVSTNYGASWTKVSSSLPSRWVTRVTADPTNDAVAYVTLSGFKYSDPLPHVFRTSNWGATWTDISSNLPDAPANDIVVDTRMSSALYLATDVGVFVSVDTGASWQPLGTGLPEGVVVNDLKFLGGTSPSLYAATFGRSMYKIDVTGTTSVPVAGANGAAPGTRLALAPGTPNPWRDATTIRFTLPAAATATLRVVDVTGRVVTTLAEGTLAAGAHEVRWDGRDREGRQVPGGVYYCRLEAGGRVVNGKTIRER